jgi:hypothetical protein
MANGGEGLRPNRTKDPLVRVRLAPSRCFAQRARVLSRHPKPPEAALLNLLEPMFNIGSGRGTKIVRG